MNDELPEIIDPTPLLPGVHVPWYFWALLAVGVLAVLGVLIYLLFFRPKPAQAADVESIYGESRRQLEALRGEADRRPLAHIATEASLAVRRYLAACLSEPALYETHEEFLLREDALTRLPEGSRTRLNPLLEELSDRKYGPSHNDPDTALALLVQSLDVLQGIESTRPKL